MSPSKLLIPMRRWWWLLLLATLFAGITSAAVLQQLDLTYRATSTLMVGQTISNPNPNSGEFFLGQQLASIYAAIGLRDPIQEAVATELGLSEMPDNNIRALPNSQFIEISVIDTDPARAQVVANEIAHQLIEQSPANTSQPGQESSDFISRQLAYLETVIDETQQDITELQTGLAAMVSAADIEDAEERLTGLQEKLATFQTNYATLLASSQTGATNLIQVLEPAELPDDPVGPSRGVIIALASALGFALASAGVYLIEYFDTTIKTPEQFEEILQTEVIGYVRDFKSLRKTHTSSPALSLGMDTDPQEDFTYALLSTNVWFQLTKAGVHSVLISSLQPGAGKTTIAINLAFQLARAGRRIALVDADLRNPGIHRYLKSSRAPGLSDLLTEEEEFDEVVRSFGDEYFSFIPAGTQRENPARWFKDEAIDPILEKLSQNIDLIIVDSPPVVVPETLLLSSMLESVMLVVRPGQVNAGAAPVLMETMANSNPNLLGVIMNRIPAYMGYSLQTTAYRRDGRLPEEDEASLFVYTSSDGKRSG